jgi:leucyl aminopeptidase (aminopeptidase T)
VSAPTLRPGEVSALAASVLRRTLGVRPGENVAIETWGHSLAWADAFVTQTRRLGAHPLVIYESESGFWDSVEGRIPRGMGVIGGHELAALDSTQAWVYLPGPASRRRLREAPDRVRRVLDDWDHQWFRAARASGVRACRLELAEADEESARFYGVDLAEWHRELIEGSRVDPAQLRRASRKMVERFRQGRRMSISHPNGTRLDLGLVGRAPAVQDGQVDEEDLRAGRNMAVLPAGYALVALDERFAEGVFVSNRASRHNRGTFAGARWTFHAGRLVASEIAEHPEVFDEAFAEGGRGRDRPALLSIGLNPKIRIAPLWEDAQRGTVAFYIGSNDDFGGRTHGEYREYALLEGADVSVDGQPLLRGGELV